MSDTNPVVNGMNILTETNSVDVLTPATTFVNQLLEVSPPVAMALVLACLCCFVLSYTRANRLAVDLGVMFIAATLYPQIADPGKVGFATHNPIVAEVITGALIGCGAVILTLPVSKLLTKIGVITPPEPQPPKDPNATSTPNSDVPPAA